MKIFNAFLIIFTATILFMLPITTLIYDFRTDLREDTFAYETGGGVTTGNVTLFKPVYENDTDTIDIVSDESDDSPLYSSYNTTSRRLAFTGLVASENRTLVVTYLIDVFEDNDTLNTLMDRLPFIWLLVIIAFAPAAIFAIFLGRA